MTLHSPSGAPIAVGDFIWFDEGVATGYIDSIFESETEASVHGFQEPALLIDLFPPTSQHSVVVGIPFRVFEDEGIGLISPDERLKIEHSLDYVQKVSGLSRASMAVFTTHDGAGNFPVVIVGYDEHTNPKNGYKIQKSKVEITHSPHPLEKLPFIAWPVQGGGRQE